jgi:N-acetylmuramoyl-L-alanine amidase CwlA
MKEIIFKKPRAKTTIIFKPDKDDDWFIDVIQFETKSGKETSRSLIIGSDVEQWKRLFVSEGWIEQVDSITETTKKKTPVKKVTTKKLVDKKEPAKKVVRKKKNPDS